MNAEVIYYISGTISGAILVGIGLAHAISEGITLGSVLLLIGGGGITVRIVQLLQSNSAVLDDRLVWFAVSMVAASVITAIWYLSLIG